MNIVIDNKQRRDNEWHNKFDFSPRTGNICKLATNQLNVLIKLQKFKLRFQRRENLIAPYFMTNFIYSPLVWLFSAAISLKEIENLQKEPLRFSYKC